MKLSSTAFIVGVLSTLLGGSLATDQTNYIQLLSKVSVGGLSSQEESAGLVWLNVTDFAPDKLPYIQDDLGIYTYDNVEELKTIAELTSTAASSNKYGDVVYLFNAFSMNGHSDSVNVTSEDMQQALLASVMPDNSTLPDQTLIQLYADTSSTDSLRQAFLDLKDLSLPDDETIVGTNIGEQKWIKSACSSAHKAAVSACKSLISSVSVDATWKSGGPRDVCRGGCCISWSANATFQIENLTNAANFCVSACGSSKVSCEVWGVKLQGTQVDQCLSNRAKGCK